MLLALALLFELGLLLLGRLTVCQTADLNASSQHLLELALVTGLLLLLGLGHVLAFLLKLLDPLLLPLLLAGLLLFLALVFLLEKTLLFFYPGTLLGVGLGLGLLPLTELFLLLLEELEVLWELLAGLAGLLCRGRRCGLILLLCSFGGLGFGGCGCGGLLLSSLFVKHKS